VHKRSPAFSVASVVADVIRVCVKLLVAAGKRQNSGSIVFSVMAYVIQLLVLGNGSISFSTKLY
jgi:hypothetical protein